MIRDVNPGQGVAHVFASHTGVNSLGQLDVAHPSAPGDLTNRVFVLAQPLVPMVAKYSNFLYYSTHFPENLVIFLGEHFFRVPSERLMRVSLIKIKKKTYAM